MDAKRWFDRLLERAYWIAGVVVAIIAYLAFANTVGWWPFSKMASPTPVAEPNITAIMTMPIPSIAPTPTPRSGDERVIGDAPMVFVPAGNFIMGDNSGDPDEKPVHTIFTDAFWIGKYEVTNSLYRRCVEAGKCQLPNSVSSSTRESYYSNTQYDNYPVIHIYWNQANTYCLWVGKRLPTEAEWEKSARGNDRRIYPWGDTFDAKRLNSAQGERGDTVATGTYLDGKSPFGIMDLAGNVWEWVADWYDESYYKTSPARNPRGPSSGRLKVIRGGGWDTSSNHVRVTNRGSDDPFAHYYNLGFRCAE